MPSAIRQPTAPGRRAVVVGGVRTPFVKAFGDYFELDTIALGTIAVRGLLERFAIPQAAIDALIWGGVLLPSQSPNIAREIALDAKLPPAIDATTVSRACTSSLMAVTLAAACIERGEADVVIAGGSDSTSNAEVMLPRKAVRAAAPFVFGKAKAGDVLGALAQIFPLSEMLPKLPKVVERTTGQTMGEAAEHMARRNEISRAAQDRFAVLSHQRAALAIASGRFAREIVPVEVERNGERRRVEADSLVRADASVDKLAALKPAFAADGTLTAGNSSALTDGAAAVLLMSDSAAKRLGIPALAHVASWAYLGVDPADQLLMGPAVAMPLALERGGYELGSIDLVDMHEAFAAQVLSVLKLLASDTFARQRLERESAVGRIDPEKLNVHGGSLALGHPFAATGARMVTTMAHELAETGKRTALLGICAAGGLAGAAVLENARV